MKCEVTSCKLILASYLWPGYNEEATHYHVLLMTMIATVKGRESLPVWGMLIPIYSVYGVLI